ncbi:MAG: hypothetical protein ACOYVF_07385 [Candidatus Zixiibacteriota bacterium]
MKHCIIFPSLALNEPINVNDLVFDSTGNPSFKKDRYTEYILENLYSILEHYFRYTKCNITISSFDSNRSFDEVIEEYFPYFLIFRFGILNNWIPEYAASEYVILRYENEDICDNLYINRNINGLYDIAPHINKFITTVEERIPSTLHTEFDIELACNIFRNLNNTQKDDIINILYLYTVANTPRRYFDEVLPILIYVMGIERYLKISKGNREFGDKLQKLFNIKELNLWGRSVFITRSNITHQNIDNISYNLQCTDNYLWRSHNESIKHTHHAAIAKEILRQIIYKILNNIELDKEKIEDLLYCNELPIEKIKELINNNIPFGNNYYKYIDLISENKIGGNISDKKKIIKFLLNYLFFKYPNIREFDYSSLNFREITELFKQLTDIRTKLEPLHWDVEITVDNVEEMQKLHYIENLIWKIQLTISQDYRHATRPSDQ